ncbi:hypothetical protein BH11PLA2_BH11PLA2_27050 [soil metagenome]
MTLNTELPKLESGMDVIPEHVLLRTLPKMELAQKMLTTLCKTTAKKRDDAPEDTDGI